MPMRSQKRTGPRRYRFFTMLFISYLLMCMVPVFLLTHVFYAKAREQVIGTSTQLIELLAVQLATSLETYIAQVSNSSLTIYSDYALIDYLGRETSYSSYERIRLNLLLHRQLSTFMTQLPNLQGVAILSESGLVYNNGFMPDMAHDAAFWDKWKRQIRAANGQLVIVPTHSQIYLPSGTVVGVFSAGRLIQDIEGRHAGILLFELSPDKLVAHSGQGGGASIPYRKRMMIETPERALIYDSSLEAAAFVPEIPAPELPGGEWMLGTDRSGKLGVTVAVPMEDLEKQIVSYRNLALIIAASMACAIAGISMLLSYQISRPINRLIRHMRRVEDGRYTPIPEEGLNVELGALTRTYNLMVLKIKNLIEDVYLAQIKQNQAKFMALQNQINPHWLYNTLESIRMQAYLSQAPDVAAMIKTLGRMFQLTLSQRDRTNLVADELEYIQVYVHLQNIRFENRFHLSVQLPEALKQTPIMKLTFQPIVENCITHGFIDPDREYIIRIEGELLQEAGIIRIADNGGGMDGEQLERVRRQLGYADRMSAGEEDSLGLRNIQERLQLHYGYEYGLSVASVLYEGTEVTIRFPIPKGDNDV
ncbi:two-component system, sensor histidine kinase YesM [Paenibacillus sp. UNCCL117]|uniref:cache domain-containing sensor histidine kinase n=1 Tax=unclassified Paenibacillus TaxID=185978 RepID=UPI00088AB95A|nr:MULTISPECIES: sensor histidine kinase [unclassified Paenibacillus]SDE02652.1 two-component system, sensor histidine kinase YesM [Paenibacillus sp. cl123]SFW57258.1 two-component system, sensor histidine kinase YesM [Paenibacillus sp. UNCCL117]